MSIKSLGIRSCLWSESSSVPGATAAGTLVTGPVSFIGILVPHLVTRLGFRGMASASIACGLTGALLMTLAEWASQTLAWPWPLSPGLLAALLGGPCFLWLLRRQTAQE